MRSAKLEKYLEENKDLKHFCEVGVYEYAYCRLIKQINEGKRVSLFECFPRCVEDIKNHTRDKQNVTLHDVAVSDFKGAMLMRDIGASAYLENLDGKCPAFQNGYAREEFGRFSVQTDTFDKYDDGSIDALFVDVEGGEWFVLKHMISRPKIIEIETHYANYKNPYMEEISKWMSENGYEEFDKTDADTIYIKK